MSGVPEIIDLLTKLALHLQTGIPSEIDNGACDPSISSFNQSLNFNERSRVRVLDTALSLMCFKAPQVFDSSIECMVKTIVTVLSSSISCKVLRFQKQDFLQIGSSISRDDCVELIGACTDVLDRLEKHGMLFNLLLHAVLRVAISASSFQNLLPLKQTLNLISSEQRNTAISKLQCFLPIEISINNHEIPLRLLLWYLDPLTLKYDISRILRETVQRPFLCLKKEFHERMDWRSIIICFVLSPTMFIQTRNLLHNWFLETSLSSIIELQVELVSLILDVLSQPIRWGISMEVGSKLPFSHAYFPNRHHLLVTLAGPLTCESFLGLVHLIKDMFSHSKKNSDPTVRQNATKAEMIDHKSIWATLMDFPCWFFFAAGLLFSGNNFQDDFLSKCTSGSFQTDQTRDAEPHCAAAATYLAWILSPINEAPCEPMVDCLTEISRSWILKQHGSNTHYTDTIGCKKKLKKPKIRDKKDNTQCKEYDSQTMRLWLKEFRDIYMRYWNKTGNAWSPAEAKAPHILSLKQNLLFRRIPLGILIRYSNSLDEEGCELLLHYATTGAILQSSETHKVGLKHLKQKSGGCNFDGDSITWSEESDKRRETVAGACLIFNLFDVLENMSTTIFETEESGIDFLCRVKVLAVRYLVKVIEELLRLKIDDDKGEAQMLVDLYRRLLRWSHQGKEIFQGYEALDDIVSALNCKISSFCAFN